MALFFRVHDRFSRNRTARLQKLRDKDQANDIGCPKKTNGQYIESPKETLELLLSTYSKYSINVDSPTPEDTAKSDCKILKSPAGRIFTANRVK